MEDRGISPVVHLIRRAMIMGQRIQIRKNVVTAVDVHKANTLSNTTRHDTDKAKPEVQIRVRVADVHSNRISLATHLARWVVHRLQMAKVENRTTVDSTT